MGKSEALSTGQASQKKELFIELDNEPRIYDVTDFVKKHPGGNVINFYLEQDATDPFTEFHFRSKKALKMLKSLPNREPTTEELSKYRVNAKTQSLLKEFRQLRADLIKEGFFDNSLPHMIYRVFELIAGITFGIYLCSKGYFYLGCIITGIFCGRCGWLMHENGHYSGFGEIGIDKVFQTILYGVGCGCSASYWRNQHNKHHATPQKIGHDVDLNTLPFVAFNEEIGKKGNPYILQFQHILYFTFLEVIGLLWTLLLHPRHAIRTNRYFELPFMFLNHILRLLPGYFYDGKISSMIISYFLTQTILVIYIFGNFTLSHTHMPVLLKDQNTDWVSYAVNHTLNIDDSYSVNWWMSYLNFQIEHHLFPSMPQYKIPRMHKRVKALVEKHGLVYHSCGYWEACVITLKNMRDVGINLISLRSNRKSKKLE